MIKKCKDYINEEIDYEQLLDEWEENEDEEDDSMIEVLGSYIESKLKDKIIYRGTFVFEYHNDWYPSIYKQKLSNMYLNNIHMLEISRFYPIIEELKIQGIGKGGNIIMKSGRNRISSKYTKILNKKGQLVEYLIRLNDVLSPTKESVKHGLKILYNKRLKKYEKYLLGDPQLRKLERELNHSKRNLYASKNNIDHYQIQLERFKKDVVKFENQVKGLENKIKKLEKHSEYDIDKEINKL